MNPTVQLLNKPHVGRALETLDIRQRRYVLQATIGRMSKSAAANDAGFTTPPTALAVQNAINVVLDELAKELHIDMEFLNRGVVDAIQIARANGEPMAMIAGYRELGKLAGKYVERIEIKIETRHISEDDMKEMSVDELNQIIEEADTIEMDPRNYERLEAS